jgi:hypothetical protein
MPGENIGHIYFYTNNDAVTHFTYPLLFSYRLQCDEEQDVWKTRQTGNGNR